MTNRFFRLALAVVLLLWAGLASAQVTPEARDDYNRWLELAGRAERVIDASRASNASLENLRKEIVDRREFFSGLSTENTDRIATLKSQLEALGPKPEDRDEPEDLANLRKYLNDQIDALRVPQVVAEEAHNRANGLIGEIDQIIRDRRTSRLLSRGPSPLNPEYWPGAWQDFQTGMTALVGETTRNWRAEATRAKMQNQLPLILFTVLIGLVLLIMGGRWAEKLGNFLRRIGGRGTGVWRFVVSLVRIALPLFGMAFLVQAALMTGILGVRGTLIAQSVLSWTMIVLAFNWLSDQLYPVDRDGDLMPSPPARRGEMIFYVRLLSLVLVLRSAVDLYDDIENLSDASRAVVAFPVILAAALLLLRIQRVGLKQHSDTLSDAQPPLRSPGVYRIIDTIRRGGTFLAIVAPILAALGYVATAEAIVYPVIFTLATMSVVLILQRFFGDLYVWLWGGGDTSARDSLFTVLIGFALAVVAVPIIAIEWGARAADITELWTKFLDGFQIGDARISPSVFLTFAVIFVAGYTATRLLQGGLRTNLLPKTKIDPGGQNAIVAFTGYVGIFLAALVAVSWAGLDLSSIAIVAGALSVGIGFGLQTIVSNFVSGIILLIERPIAKGDWIEVGGFAGYVRDISVRSTRIETFDRADVIVPNSDLIAGTVTNYTRGKTVGRLIVPIGVAYGTDTRMVEEMLLEIANDHPMVLANPGPNVVFRSFGADSLDFEIRAILRDVNWIMSVRSDLNHEIAKRFADADIEIPFAQRDIWLRNPEALSAQAAQSAPPVPPASNVSSPPTVPHEGSLPPETLRDDTPPEDDG